MAWLATPRDLTRILHTHLHTDFHLSSAGRRQGTEVRLTPGTSETSGLVFQYMGDQNIVLAE